MRKFLLISALAALGYLANAQTMVGSDHHQFQRVEHPMVSHQSTTIHARPQYRSARASGASILNSQRIGSAGNMYSVLEGNCRMVDANSALNFVTFAHRNDDHLFVNTNLGQYRFDRSMDRGLTWTSNVGPITENPQLLDGVHNGRYPQGIIYNPTGNLIADSALFIYSGTWHDQPAAGGAGTWVGDLRGRGKLTGDSSNFNVHLDSLNNAMTAIGTGLTQGAPGVFWNVNQDYTGNFSGGAQLTTGVIIEKGVWNTVTRDVDWTVNANIPQNFIQYSNNGTNVSAATSFSIAFDPTGQYGWVACLGDTIGNSGYQPILWRTVDAGANWTGPYIMDLTSIPQVVSNLGTVTATYATTPGTPTTLIPTTAFELALTVDVNGTPHILTTVGNQVGSATPYGIEDAGYDIWDFTYNVNATAGCQWQGTHLAKTGTFAAQITNDASPNQVIQDHRPQISRSDDGTKVFCFWVTSDVAYVEANFSSEDNLAPNLFGRGIDVSTSKMTPLYNFTAGDSLWGGQTTDSAVTGVFGGAIFPSIGQNCLFASGVYNVPLVFTQTDYDAATPGIQQNSGINPAAFWYVNNINIPASAFTANTDSAGPVITLNGQDTIELLVGSSFTDPGATAYDCVSGNAQVNIFGTVDTTTAGVYTIYYYATDASGNSDTVTRTVIIGGIPVAAFSWTFQNGFPYKAQFVDHSTNIPTSWAWTFAPPAGSTLGQTVENPFFSFTSDGIWTVCLVATNQWGSSPVQCHSVDAEGVGISEVEFAQHVNLFPNPTSGKVSISISENATPDFTISVTNTLGEAVIAPSTFKAGTTHVEMDMSALASGIYLVKIQSSNASVVKQLTVTQK